MVKSALRVFEIMEFVSEADLGRTHTEIATGLGIPGSSLTALLRDLTGSRYLDQDSATGRYSIGPQVLKLSTAYMRYLNLVRIGQPIAHEVFEEVQEYTSLAIMRELTIIKICEFVIPDPKAYAIRLGESSPIHATAAGKAILAFFPKHERDAILSRLDFRVYTKNTIRTPERLLAELNEIQAGSTAYMREELLEGMIGMAAPIFNMEDKVAGAITVTTPVIRFTADHEVRIERALRRAATRISAQLGHQRSLAAA